MGNEFENGCFNKPTPQQVMRGRRELVEVVMV
jgi:hypothetical protein